MADVYIGSSSRDLLEFKLSGETNTDLTVDLNLDECVKANSPFINFGKAAPGSSTPGKIYIQIED